MAKLKTNKILCVFLSVCMIVSCMVGMSVTASAETTVNWNAAAFESLGSGATKDNITFTSSKKQGTNLYNQNGGTHTFSVPDGMKIKKIEFLSTYTTFSGNASYSYYSNVNHRDVEGYKVTWTGDSQTVSFTGNAYACENFVFTLDGTPTTCIPLTEDNRPTITIKRGEDTVTTGAPQGGDVLVATTTANYLEYEWYRDDDVVDGATESTYTLTAADVGKAIKVKVYQTKNEDLEDLTGDDRPTQTSDATADVTYKVGPALSNIPFTFTKGPTHGQYDIPSSGLENIVEVEALIDVADIEWGQVIIGKSAGEQNTYSSVPIDGSKPGVQRVKLSDDLPFAGANYGCVQVKGNAKLLALSVIYKDGTKSEAGAGNWDIPEFVAPTAKTDLFASGQPQALINAGEITNGSGVFSYSLNGNDFDTEIPKATTAGTYTVYTKINYGDNGNDIYAPVNDPISVTINEISPYEVIIPATLSVTDEGWNDGFTISATGTLADGKKLTVTASSANSDSVNAFNLAYTSGDDTYKIPYHFAADEDSIETPVTSWEFFELSDSEAATASAGVVVGDFGDLPGGNYTDTVTFKVSVEDDSVDISAYTDKLVNFTNVPYGQWKNSVDTSITEKQAKALADYLYTTNSIDAYVFYEYGDNTFGRMINKDGDIKGFTKSDNNYTISTAYYVSQN